MTGCELTSKDEIETDNEDIVVENEEGYGKKGNNKSGSPPYER